jgi:hypothetical protein
LCHTPRLPCAIRHNPYHMGGAAALIGLSADRSAVRLFSRRIGLERPAAEHIRSLRHAHGVARTAKTSDSTALGSRSMVRMGPVVWATVDPPGSPPTLRHLTSPLTVVRELRRCRLAWRSPPSRSHGGSQGFKSPHLHPKHCRSERRQRRAGGAYCILRPRRGRKLTSQCSWEGSPRPGNSAQGLTQ